MNDNLLKIINQITSQYGEDILGDAKRLKSLFSDLAKDEPKPLRMAFCRCAENGFYGILQNTKTPEERREVIDVFARRLRDEEGLDLGVCTEALELFAAAVFGEGAVAPANTQPDAGNAADGDAPAPDGSAKSGLPQPPAEYEEIRFASFDKYDYKAGRKFWSRVVLEKQTDDKIVCKREGGYPVSFILLRPLPALPAEDLELIVMFTTAPAGENPVLDAAILYDQWLLSPPVESYEEIDIEDFLRIKEDGTIMMKKYQFTARYDHFNVMNVMVVHPDLEKSGISAYFVAYNKPPPVGILKYQKVVVRFTKYAGKSPEAVQLDDIEALPLPQPPAGYEEIDEFDLNLGFQNHRFEPGHKLCSRCQFSQIKGTQVIFYIGDEQTLAFDLTKRPPKMVRLQTVLVLYTFASYTSRPNCTLDDILVV